MEQHFVSFERDASVGFMTLNRPAAGNAVTPDVIMDLAHAVAAAESSGCRALVVAGAGPNFCVGADLELLTGDLADMPAKLASMATAFHAVLLRLARLPLPVIAAVQGAAVGAGMGLALASDFMICADSLKFSTGYARLGLSSDAGVSFFLTKALGVRRARELLMTSRVVLAAEALALGLAQQVVPQDELRSRASETAQRLATGPTSAFAAIKRLTDAAACESPLDQHLELEAREIVTLAHRSDVQGAAAAILARKDPAFSG
jgi:2-(1,2-epoxy-1,2-dihydrophenyl)acetyl-CoA isomerase